MRSRACCEWSGPAALSSQTLRRSFIKVIQQLHEAPIKRHEINKHIDLQSTRIRRVPAGTISVNANLSWSIHQSADCQKKQTYTKIKEYKVILHNKSLIRSNRHVSAALVRCWKNQKVLNWNILSALFPFFVQSSHIMKTEYCLSPFCCLIFIIFIISQSLLTQPHGDHEPVFR